MSAPETHARGEALVRKWAPKFGLGDWRITVMALPPDTPDAWARSYFDLDETWAVIDLPADDVFSPALQELLVCHELAHGLLMMAEEGGHAEERACNRIARLARGDWESRLANEERAYVVGEEWYGTDKVAYDRREWLPVVTDALPEREREVINALYWEGKSLREYGDEKGVSYETVRRRRDEALTKLASYFKKLETADWHTARKVIALKEPEGGAEHGVIYELHHRCPAANALIRVEGIGREDMDLLVFPVGNVGFGMPKGIPFAVAALDACGACGRDVGAWFVWQAGRVDHPGSIWTPGGD